MLETTRVGRNKGEITTIRLPLCCPLIFVKKKTIFNSCYARQGFYLFCFVLPSGFVQSLEFLKKSGNLRTTFPDLEKVWKLKAKSWKMGLSLEFFSRSSRCLKASWNLCNVADFTWINLANGKTLHNRRRYGRRVRLFQVREPSLRCPALHYSSLCLQCIMVYLFPALVERSKQCLFAFMH